MTEDSNTEPRSEETALAILPESESGWEAAIASNLQPRMLRALKRVAQGSPIREAAEAEGYKSHSDLYRHSKRFGLIDARTKAIIAGHRHIALVAGQELERRLTTDPDSISTHATGVIGGISTDKVLAYEKLQTDDGGTYLSALEKVAARVAASGAELELKVTIKPGESEPETVELERLPDEDEPDAA